MHQASVGFHCPECVKQGAQKVYRGPAALAGARPVLTQLLIAVNVAVFLWGVAKTGSSAIDGANELALDGGLIASFRGIPVGVGDGEWYRIITSGFLHYGIIHLLFNMYALWILGGMLERTVGRVQLGLAYFVSIIGGAVGALLLSPDTLTVGASGGIFGLMGAVLALGRSRGISIRQSPVFGVLILNLLLTFGLSSSISVGGHIGGLAAGFAAGMLLFELPPQIDRGGANRSGGAVSGAVVGLGLSVALGVVLFVAAVAIGQDAA
jgi:membrane associated rhomboid family serine protease